MVKRIDELTPQQAARMPEWRDRWIKLGLSCEPMTDADRVDVERSLRLLYARANLPEPKSVQFVPSPFALRLATGFAGGAIHAVRNGWPNGDSAVDSAVRSAVGSAVRSAVGSAPVSDHVHFLLQCAVNAWYLEWGGSLWPGYMAWATFFRDVCDLDIEQADAFAAYEVLSSQCGFYSLHHDFAMVSDRPVVLRRNGAGRLHADNGPAIAFRDGWHLYFWHGFQIPRSHEWLISEPERLTLDAIFGERNAELRRIAFEIGMSRPAVAEQFAQRARVISHDVEHGQPRRLLELKLGSEPIRILEVINGSLEPDGSRRKFHLGAARSPDGAMPNTPHAAVAASYGISERHYHEQVRT